AIPEVHGGAFSGHVFVPNFAPSGCGWDKGGAGGQGGGWDSEHYSSQNQWGSVTSSCPYTACSFTGAGFFLHGHLLHDVGASGTLIANGGFALRTADKGGPSTGESPYVANATVMIVAKPVYPTSVSISGGCSVSGGPGVPVTCNVSMTSDKSITVNFSL